MIDVAAQRPHFSAEDAQRFARELFGRNPSSARQLPSDRDQNFYLEEPSGEAFVLKIASAAETAEVLDFQNQVLLHLAKSQQVAFPQPLPSGDAYIATVTGSGSVELALPRDASADIRADTGSGGIRIELDQPVAPRLDAADHRELDQGAAAVERTEPDVVFLLARSEGLEACLGFCRWLREHDYIDAALVSGVEDDDADEPPRRRRPFDRQRGRHGARHGQISSRSWVLATPPIV